MLTIQCSSWFTLKTSTVIIIYLQWYYNCFLEQCGYFQFFSGWMHSQQVVRQLGKSPGEWFTWSEVKCPLLQGIWVYSTTSQKISERVFFVLEPLSISLLIGFMGNSCQFIQNNICFVWGVNHEVTLHTIYQILMAVLQELIHLHVDELQQAKFRELPPPPFKI